jgi:hypothetical protein
LLQPVLHHVAHRDHANDPAAVSNYEVAEVLTGHPSHHVFQRVLAFADGRGPHHRVLHAQLVDGSAMLVHGANDLPLAKESDCRAVRSQHGEATDVVPDKEFNGGFQIRLGLRRDQTRALVFEQVADAHCSPQR